MENKTCSLIWHLRQHCTVLFYTKVTPNRKSIKTLFRCLSACINIRSHPYAKLRTLFYFTFDRRIDLLKQNISKMDMWWWVFLSVINELSQKKISDLNYISFDSAWQGELKKTHAILLILKMSNFSEKHDWEKRYIKWKRLRCRKNQDISHFTHFFNL